MGLLSSLGISTKKEKKLKETGIAINAVVKDISVNNSVSINGRNPRRLVCEGTLPNGTTQYFESGNVSATVHPSVIGQPIMVYVDRNDPKKYYVDAEQYK